MNIWEILGIGITDDSAAIKSAYAGKLKVCHPEDDPEGFQQLREAFERASKYAKARAKMAGMAVGAGGVGVAGKQGVPGDSAERTEKETEKEKLEWIYQKDQQSSFPMPEFPDNNAETHLPVAFQTGTAEFFYRMQVLYDDFDARIEIDNWNKILQSDLLWNMKAKEVLRPMVLRFFAEHPVLPQSVWQLMDTEFGWSDSSTRLPDDCGPEIMILLREIDPKWDLCFSQFHKEGNTGKEPGRNEAVSREPRRDAAVTSEPSMDEASADQPTSAVPAKVIQQESLPIWSRGQPEAKGKYHIDFSLFAQCRRNLRDAIIDDSDVEAEGFYMQTVSVFENDPDIYRIYFDYLNSEMPNGRIRPGKDMHLKIVNKLIEFYPDNHTYLIKRADLCLNRAFYEIAIHEYLILVVMFPDNLEILFHLAAAYSGAGMMRQKRRCFRQIDKTYAKTQERLRLNKGRSIDRIATEEQIKANERMFAERQRIPADSFSTNLHVALAVIGAFVIIAAMVIIAQKIGLYDNPAKITMPVSGYSQKAAAEQITSGSSTGS